MEKRQLRPKCLIHSRSKQCKTLDLERRVECALKVSRDVVNSKRTDDKP